MFQILSLVILALFYGCFFNKMRMQKRKGVQTNQIGKGKTGFTKWVEIIMKAASCLVIAVEAVSILLNTSAFPAWVRMVGLLLMTAGLVFFVTAVFTMRDSWRAGVPYADHTALVTSGIFQISRNPAFLGFDLVYIGIVLSFFNLPLFIISLIACLMLHLQIVNNEEPFLQETFGGEYLEYKKRVNRYLGRQ